MPARQVNNAIRNSFCKVTWQPQGNGHYYDTQDGVSYHSSGHSLMVARPGAIHVAIVALLNHKKHAIVARRQTGIIRKGLFSIYVYID